MGNVGAVAQDRVAQGADGRALEDGLVAEIEAEAGAQEDGAGHVVVGDIGIVDGAVAVEAADVFSALVAAAEDAAGPDGQAGQDGRQDEPGS